MSQPPCVGFVQLTFFDDTTGEAVPIGGAGFLSRAEEDAAWSAIEVFDGQSSFQADRMDAVGDIVDDKTISAETCERLMGRPIAELIAEGRANLATELASYQRAAA